MTLPITVVIPVKNEEANLPRCLESLGHFAKVVVVDSGSTDRTRDIARDAGATILDFSWDGRYPKKRNWMLINHPPQTQWVLFLDADEVVNDKFCQEAADAIKSDGCDGYWLSYTNHFLGRRLRHGVPQRKLALFKVGHGLYERIEENTWSSLDMEIHEHPIVKGNVGTITAPIDHDDFRGIEKFIRRHRDYAMWEARRALLLAQNDSVSDVELTDRQRLKYNNLERWWYPWAYFVYAYIVKLGFLDGAAGFQYAFYKLWYFNSIRLMIAELRKQQPQAPSAVSAG